MKRYIFLVLLFVFYGASISWSQQLVSGYIIDEAGDEIPYAKIYVKNNSDLRTIADENGYYQMRIVEGEYFLIITALGYDDREVYLVMKDQEIVLDHYLITASIKKIEGVDIKTKRYNPGREIMLKAVDKRKQMNQWSRPHSVEGYTKATETIIQKEIKKKKKDNVEISDSLKQGDKKEEKSPYLKDRLNLVEVKFTRHYESKSKVKEIRSAYELHGSQWNHLYYTTTIKSNFNFFQNLIHLDDLHQSPVSSPISVPGILSYKYRLDDQYIENGKKIHKIKIIPRKTATSTLSGYIYVVDSTWLIQKLDLTLEKGNLLIYDYFNIQQFFDHPGDSICVLNKQVLDYGVKYFGDRSECKTITQFTDYNFSPDFAPDFFGNEVAITTKEAYDRDSSYWEETRAESLTKEELQLIFVQDSIYAALHRVEYLDSIDSVYNKITLVKVLLKGVGHVNRSKKTRWNFGSLPGLIQPLAIAGPRISPRLGYYKKWESEKTIFARINPSVGLLNGDVKGRASFGYFYSPFRFGSVFASVSRSFATIRDAESFAQIYKRDNFIESINASFNHRSELFNGLYLSTGLSISHRESLEGYKFVQLDSILPNSDPIEFEAYQSSILTLKFEYTPFQKYMREPAKKVILGSRWPTFYLDYEKGISKLFGSDVNHDYISGGLKQTLKIGTIGTSSYHIKSGMFLNSKSLKEVDQKFHMRSTPIFFVNPLNSFQAIDTLLPTQKTYLEAHFVHHDNSAIINKIPFMKKTRIGLVAGVGALFLPEHHWQYYEVYAGLERTFKIARERLRIGIYGVLSDGSHRSPRPGLKVSFDILDSQDMTFGF